MRFLRNDRRPSRRSGGTIVSSFLALALLAGCSEDSPTTQCVNCEDWVQLTRGLGRHPEPHPVTPDFVAYSTVDKIPGSLDENREADEDVWLVWIQDENDPGLNLYYQITGEEMGLGDNFAPRWNPSGTEILFTHSTPSQSEFQVWRVPVQVPTSPTAPPTIGTPVMVASRGRDPDWVSDTTVLYSSALKLYSVDLPAGGGPPTGPPTQQTFDPPTYVGAETYFDRHPTTSPDGMTVFNTLARRNVADVHVAAFEIDESGPTPDTTATAAFVYLETPDSPLAVYPVIDRADTVRTPAFLQSLPVDGGGDFTFGVRLDSRLLMPPVETYCDTTLISTVSLQPNGSDSLQFYFKLARGDLQVNSDLSGTNVFWSRADASGASGSADGIQPGVAALFECLSSWSIDAQGVPAEGDTVDYYLTSVRQTKTQRDTVRVLPGQTTFVRAFRTGTVVGTVAFSNDMIPPFPIANISVTEQDSAFVFVSGSSDRQTGDFSFNLTGGTWDFRFTRAGYDTLNVNGVVVDPFSGADLGTVTMNPTPPGATARSTHDVVTVHPFPLPDETPRSRVLIRSSRGSSRETTTDLRAALRAEGDLSTIWRMDLASPARTDLHEIFGSEAYIQNPALTVLFSNGKRYVAYASDVNGDWDVWVQRLDAGWGEDGEPMLVETPGVVNNFFCSRSALHPRWVIGSQPPNLRLVVTLSGCPENQFDDVGFDDDPWAQGEFRVWEVSLTGYE